MYYLRSRYYKDEWLKFIIADILTKRNQFSYCGNNPIKHIDTEGLDYILCDPNKPIIAKRYGREGELRELERGTVVETFQVGSLGFEGIILENQSEWIIQTGHVVSYQPVEVKDVFGVDELKRGDRGKYVEHLQTALKSAGYYHGKMDGIYGGDTKKAVVRFRKYYLGDKGDKLGGTAGPRVKKALFDMYYQYFDSLYAYHLSRGENMLGMKLEEK